MVFHRNTTVSVVLTSTALVLSGCQFFLHSGYDLRLIASILCLVAYTAAGSEMPKYSSSFQIFGIFFSMLALGVSLDHNLPFVPFISISLMFSFLMHRKFFRTIFSESDFYMMDMVVVIASFSVYVFGNVYNNLGWKGWVLPLYPLSFNAYMTISDFIFTAKSLKHIKDKKLNIEVGKTAPLFSLPDKDGNIFHLADFKGKQHVLLVFIRNDWCPSCRIKLRTYDNHRHKFNEKNIQLLTISPPEKQDKNIHATLGIQMKILYDTQQEVCKKYGVQLPAEVVGGANSPGMPLPASFLVDVNGIVRYTSRPDRIGEFLDPTTIFPVLESLN